MTSDSEVEKRRTADLSIHHSPFAIRPSHLLHLTVFELDRRGAAEDRHGDLEAGASVVDLLDHAVERGKGAVGDAHVLADLERDGGFWTLDAVGDLALD